ncbi:hypothetical protein [Nonomuraea dietziae]
MLVMGLHHPRLRHPAVHRDAGGMFLARGLCYTIGTESVPI